MEVFATLGVLAAALLVVFLAATVPYEEDEAIALLAVVGWCALSLLGLLLIGVL